MSKQENKQAPWLNVARHFIGEQEIPGKRSSPSIREMFSLCGRGDITRDETPWCAAFVGACLALSGWRNTQSLSARSYLRFGKKLSKPLPGAIAVFWRKSRHGPSGHVGFFLSEKGGRIEILGGNQNDAVSIKTFPKSRLLGYRWPSAPAPLPRTQFQTISDLSQAARALVFEAIVDVILRLEGGYVDHPKDPGGATNRGITLKTLQKWRGKPTTKQDVRALSKGEAKEIYQRLYWDKISGNRLPKALALLTFNAAVLSGPNRAIKILQSALNHYGASLIVDGEIGPLTLGAVQTVPERSLTQKYDRHYRVFLRSLKAYQTFGRGWERRLNTCLNIAGRWVHSKNGDAKMNNGALPETDTLVLLHQTIERLSDLSEKVDRLSNTAERGDEPDLTGIDRVLGGRFFKGKKTILAVVGYVGLEIWRLVSGIDVSAGGADAELYSLLISVVSAFGGLGLVSKAERILSKKQFSVN